MASSLGGPEEAWLAGSYFGLGLWGWKLGLVELWAFGLGPGRGQVFGLLAAAEQVAFQLFLGEGWRLGVRSHRVGDGNSVLYQAGGGEFPTRSEVTLWLEGDPPELELREFARGFVSRLGFRWPAGDEWPHLIHRPRAGRTDVELFGQVVAELGYAVHSVPRVRRGTWVTYVGPSVYSRLIWRSPAGYFRQSGAAVCG